MARELIWLRPAPRAGVGRPAEWSRDQITAAAIAVAQADGLTAVSMRRVAAELGAGASSLYRHLATRDDLLDLMVDHAFAEYEPVADTGDWRADVVAEFVRLLGFLRARPWLIDITTIRPALGPEVIRFLERTLGRMSAHPASGATKMETYGVLTGLVQTHAQQERRGGVLDDDFVATQAAFLRHMAFDGDHPHLAAALSESLISVEESLDDRFGRILALVLGALLPQS